MSVPEPAPLNEGLDVSEELMSILRALKKDATLKLVEERRAFGIEKYGQSLMSGDGRNEIEDARQEMGDLLQYVFKITLNKHLHSRGDIDNFKTLWAEVKTLVDQFLRI